MSIKDLNLTKKKVGVILLIAALICAIGAGIYYYQEKTAGDEYEEIQREAAGPEAPVIEEPAPVEELPPEEPVAQSPIDFAAVQAKCPDAYAWIHIEGTNVDYPIVQHPTDDSFYLTHSAEGGSSKAGAIYTEMANTKTFMDPNTVIYGHNMKNGSMFRTLHSFEDRSFFDQHVEILIYTPETTLHYQIFAAYRSDNRHILNSYNFADPYAFAAYLEDIKMKKSMSAFIRDDVPVTADSHIITLSTCTGDASARYLVQAVLVG